MTRRTLQLVMLVSAAALAACQTRVVHESFPTLRAHADKSSSRADPRDPTGGGGWSILVKELEGEKRYAELQSIYSLLRRYELPQLWYEDVGGKTLVYCGRFSAAADAEAQLALRSLTGLEVDGERPYKKVRLIPLVGGHHVKLDPFDLQQFVGFFTLQVAVFTPDYAGDRKAAAEKMTRELRARDEEAYFYHGPRNSSVCIGLFTWDDFEQAGAVSRYGPRILKLQEQHPYNIIDGKTPTPDQTAGADSPDAPQPQRSIVFRVI